MVSLANNHALDYGSGRPARHASPGSTTPGVAHAGAGADVTAARQPALLITPAGTVAVLAFTDMHRRRLRRRRRAARASSHHRDGKKILAAIRGGQEEGRLRHRQLPLGHRVHRRRPRRYQRKLAHKCVDAGADLVLGHHPHVIQGMEVYKDKLIAYSLGDFVFDHYPGPTGEAFILRVTLQPGGPPSSRSSRSTWTTPRRSPPLVTGTAADAILDRLTC